MVVKSGMKRTLEAMMGFLDASGGLSIYYDDLTGKASKQTKSMQREVLNEHLDKILWELVSVEADAVKNELLMYTCQQELKAYELLHSDIDQSIISITKDINRLKEVVASEKTIRMYKEEYENAARLVNQLPSQQNSTETLEGLEEQLRLSSEALQSLSDRMALKAKEFALLMRAIRDLQCIAREETEEIEAETQVENEPLEEGDDKEYVMDGDKESKRCLTSENHGEFSPREDADVETEGDILIL
jgi:hypothetical protein